MSVPYNFVFAVRSGETLEKEIFDLNHLNEGEAFPAGRVWPFFIIMSKNWILGIVTQASQVNNGTCAHSYCYGFE